jgi:hypothetical protein
MWDGGTCFIIGGGPSMPYQFNVPEEIIGHVMEGRMTPHAYSEYMIPLHDKHVIGVNNAYQIGMWLDVLFFGDYSWYLVHRRRLAEWPKVKVTCTPRFDGGDRDREGIKYLQKDNEHKHGISQNKYKLAWNANSGAATINLAAYFGVKRIVLLGFDMCLNDNSISHWHGSHKDKGGKTKRVPPFGRHLKGFPKIAEDAKGLGIEILNASPKSAIKDFKKIHVKEVL